MGCDIGREAPSSLLHQPRERSERLYYRPRDKNPPATAGGRGRSNGR